ncbi:hypothetical protein AB0B30_28920 [Streptomyces narbonensis]|uniref:Uncharacterized protein n=1 Tax=Streptomyces narbonensis TaxID=67333 RepID=A0ABV3CJ56_9ACTN
MTAEHPRPTSRITDALLPPPPPAAQAPARHATAPTAQEPRERGTAPAQANAPAPAAPHASAPNPHGAAERPTAPPAPRSAPAPAPRVAAPAAEETAERPAQANAPVSAPAPHAPAPTTHGSAPRPTTTPAPASPRPASTGAPALPAAAPAAPRPAKPTGAPQSQAAPVPARPASPPAPASRPATGPATGVSCRTAVSAPLPQETAPLSPRQAPVTARAWAAPSGADDLPEVERTTRLRAIRGTSGADRPSRTPASPPSRTPASPSKPTSPPTPTPASPPTYGYGLAGTLPPETPVETTTRLRPVRPRRTGRVLAVTACVVLGGGLIGGALAGIWLASAEPARPAEPAGYTEAKDLWHNAPVDTLFPRTLPGPGAGPGAAARTWTRIVVAPDAPCSPAVLGKGLLATLTPLGCERVLRATYTDATASSVITVGLVFTRADAEVQRTLGQGSGGLTARLGEDVPPALSGPSTVAARFGARQRASWWLSAPADLPVVVTAVSGFADGRALDRPQPADRAMARGRTDATAQSGLGHEAKGITARFEALLRKAVAATVKEKENAR